MKRSNGKRRGQANKYQRKTAIDLSETSTSSEETNHQAPTCSSENNEQRNESASSGREIEIQTFPVKNIVCKCKMVREDNGEEDLFLEVEFNPVEVSISGIPFKRASDLSKIHPITNEQWETDQLKHISEVRHSNKKWEKDYCPYCEPYVKPFTRFHTLKQHVKDNHPEKMAKDIIWQYSKNNSSK